MAKSAGRIEEIFMHRRVENKRVIVDPFLTIREYVPLSLDHQEADPFGAFPDLDTKLYYDKLGPARVVPLRDVVSHAAVLTCTPDDIGRQCIIAKSLDRVRGFTFFHCEMLNMSFCPHRNNLYH